MVALRFLARKRVRTLDGEGGISLKLPETGHSEAPRQETDSFVLTGIRARDSGIHLSPIAVVHLLEGARSSWYCFGICCGPK
jgi:hypothetical protein